MFNTVEPEILKVCHAYKINFCRMIGFVNSIITKFKFLIEVSCLNIDYNFQDNDNVTLRDNLQLCYYPVCDESEAVMNALIEQFDIDAKSIKLSINENLQI